MVTRCTAAQEDIKYGKIVLDGHSGHHFLG